MEKKISTKLLSEDLRHGWHMKKIFSSIASSSLGNILEWYDFGLFTIFSALFGRLFFPSENQHTALIATISIFAVGFLCRPIGALLFGYMGDRKGRARTLRLSVLMISVPTLLIGCLPTYQQIGLLAPVLLTLTRVWQGISIGGEYSGNLIYLAESAPHDYRATVTSFASIGANLGVLLAAIVGIIIAKVFPEEALTTWGWRVPYLLSGILCILIYMFRLRLRETNVFEYLKDHQKLAHNPIKIALEKNYWEILRTLGLVCFGSTYYYFCFVYIPIFLRENLQFSVSQVSVIMTFLITCMLFLVPGAGWICDKLGRRKMLLFNAILTACIVIPGFYFLQKTNVALIIVILSIFTIASSLEQGTTCIAVVENFPPPARYTGLSLGYNIGNGFLGGTVPILCAWLIAYSAIAPAIYIACCAAVTALVVYFFVPETKGESLRN